MNDREKELLVGMLSSKKYGAFPEEVVRRVFSVALENHRNVKDAEKAARARLHQMSAMFFSEKERKQAFGLLEDGKPFDGDKLKALMQCHASTRERAGDMDALYDRVFQRIGGPRDVVDYACGLNPLYLGFRKIPTLGMDIHGDAVMIVNRFSEAAGYPVQAEMKDLLGMEELPQGELALVMKLLPVLEREKKGFAQAFLQRIPCKHLLVTFPRRTLGARSVGMEAHYTEWFESLLPKRFEILDRFVTEDELCYLAVMNHG